MLQSGVPLITNFDPTRAPYQGCFRSTGILGQPTLNGASLLGQAGLTDEICLNFCINIAVGRPFSFFGISAGTNCFCGNTPPATVAGLPNEGLCTTPNLGNNQQAGGGPDAINVWSILPGLPVSPSSLPIGLPTTISLPLSQPVSLPSGLPSSLPISLPVGLPSGVSSLPVDISALPSSVGALPTGVPGLSSLVSVISALPTEVSLPVSALPTALPEVSSLLSAINSLQSGLSLSVPPLPTGLPSGAPLPTDISQDLSSLASVIGGLPSGSIPSGLPEVSSLLSVIGSLGSSLSIPVSAPLSSLGLPIITTQDLNTLPSLISALPTGVLSGGLSLPTISPLPTGIPEVSSLLSVIGSIQSGLSLPITAAPTGLPVSSLLSIISSLESRLSTTVSALPTGTGSNLPDVDSLISVINSLLDVLNSAEPGIISTSGLLGVSTVIPQVSVPPTGVSVPISALPTGLPDLSSLLSVISALPTGSVLPSGLPDLSSVLSQLSALSTGLPLPTGIDLSSAISQISALPTVAVPGPGLSSGLPDLSSILSQISALPSSDTLPSGLLSNSLLPQLSALPTTVSLTASPLPTNLDLSSLISRLSALPPASGEPLPSNLPGLSSLLSSLSALSTGTGLPVSALPTDVPGLSSLISQPNALPSGVSSVPTGFIISVLPSISSSPAINPSGPSTVGVPLPPVPSVSNPATLVYNNDPLGQFLGCVSSTGLNGQPLFDGPSIFNPSLTQITCRLFCKTQPGAPYLFYAIEQGNLCHCSKTLVSSNVVVNNGACNIPVSGDPTKTEAGGGQSNSVVFRNLEPVIPVNDHALPKRCRNYGHNVGEFGF
ncbi:hypothetical protein BDU57DRAFT_596697 [Ampelomyces quisqualis]|uniref:WSC domain-containing protein n=1 Tax=Ampelomyces quisqualis TaxID=50730 RepID=A0A6A5QJ37_AMPQU|nr:hypothetical protein BDU57DRAFT_596697 [Ampelomyces quisqualis]